MKKFFIKGKILVGATALAAVLATGCGDSENFVFTNTGNVPVPVQPAPPVAVNDAFNALGNATVNQAAAGVLANDTTNGASIASFDPVGSQGGSIVLNPDGSFTYTPVFGYVGAETFGYTLANNGGTSQATVTMTSNGTLMRLSEPDFQSLLVKPVIESINEDELNELLTQPEPKAYILDVRTLSEVAEDKIPGSLNVPLLLLRKNLSKLKKNAIYFVACDGGSRSKLAAYQLIEKGLTAYVLKRK